MRVVTVGTAGVGHRIVHMRLQKDRTVDLVAADAERRDAVLEKRKLLARGVGIVACCTTFRYRAMLEAGLGDGFHHVLVAFETEVVPPLEQIVFATGAVGIVAFHAGAVRNYLVNTFRIRRDHPGMARGADFTGIRRKQLAVGGTVGIMATRAVTLFERRVHERLGKLLLEGRVATETEFAAGAGLQFKLQGIVLGVGYNAAAQEESEKSKNQCCMAKIHGELLLSLSHYVAILARPAGKGRMYRILEELGVLRCMWIMTAHAIHGFYAYVQVRLAEARGFQIVTLAAELLLGIRQERCLRGKVGLVATLAVALRRIMGGLF